MEEPKKEELKKEEPKKGITTSENVGLGKEAEQPKPVEPAYEIKPLEKMSLKELQDKAERLGFKGANVFKERRQLIVLIQNIQAQKIVTGPAIPRRGTQDEVRWQSKRAVMLKKLLGQPKVRMFVPITGKEKRGEARYEVKKDDIVWWWKNAVVHVNLNGCKWVVPKGVYVEVPQQVAEVLGESLNQQVEAGRHLRVDRDERVEAALTA